MGRRWGVLSPVFDRGYRVGQRWGGRAFQNRVIESLGQVHGKTLPPEGEVNIHDLTSL